MIEFGGVNAVATAVARQEYDVASGELAGEKLVRGGAEGGFDRDPFLAREPFDVVEAAAADDADAILRHGGQDEEGRTKGKVFSVKFSVFSDGGCGSPGG